MGISYSVEHGTYIGTEFLCSLGFDARNLFRNRNFPCDSNGLTRPAGPDLVNLAVKFQQLNL